MEKERDWFREEALRLNKLQKDQKAILDRLKSQIETAQAERDYCHGQLLEEKMNSKALVIENLKFRKNQIKSISDGDGISNNVVEKALMAIENGLNIEELK